VRASSHRVQGVTRRRGQVVRIDCSVTIVYDVIEATGAAVLPQRYEAHLRTRRLRNRTRYELECNDPLILELPTDASDIRAAATASGEAVELVRAPVASLPLAGAKRLRAEPQTQFAVVGWPRALPSGDYSVELDFDLSASGPLRMKAIYAASVSCGRSTYVQPILPVATSMARVPAFSLDPSTNPATILLPRIAGAAGLHAELTHTLSC